MYIDIMFVNGMPMLTSINKPIRNRALVCLNDRTVDSIYNGLDKILRSYNDAGFTVTVIHSDREFKSIMDDVKDNLDIKMEYPAKGDHVPEAKRNNRTIGERIRAGYNCLPFKAMPKVLLRYLSMVSTNQLNFFPAKGGVSAYYSPYMIMKKKNLDYEKD